MGVAVSVNGVRTFIILRLFIATLLLFLANFFFRTETLIFYYIIAIVSFLSAGYLIWLLMSRGLRVLIWFQIMADVLLETVLIACTGGVDSMFAPIYVLSIISAGMMIAPGSSFIIATISGVCFSSLAVFLYQTPTPPLSALLPSSPYPDHDPLYLFYATYVRITMFFIVAILTHYMTRRLLKLEEKVRVQERLVFLGQIASSIAHEIRNPLATISASVEVLSEALSAKLTGDNAKLMSAVVDESDRLRRVFNKLLDYSRHDELQIEQTPIDDLLDRILFLHSNSGLANENVRIKKHYPHRKPVAPLDPFQMQEAFGHVIRNAFDAMPAAGALTISVTEQPRTYEILIADTGKGIGRDVLESLFLPFKTTKKTGTGLGLAEAHKIITQHGGKIEVKSQVGRGTQVKITILKTLSDTVHG